MSPRRRISSEDDFEHYIFFLRVLGLILFFWEFMGDGRLLEKKLNDELAHDGGTTQGSTGKGGFFDALIPRADIHRVKPCLQFSHRLFRHPPTFLCL